MKTIIESTTIPAVLSPTVIILGLLAAAVVGLAVFTKNIPLLSNPRIAVIVLVVLGMAMCTSGGIGRVAALGTWTHPQAIIGYVLGVAILLAAGALAFGIKLPFLAGEQQTLLFVAGLVVVKILNALLHIWLFKS